MPHQSVPTFWEEWHSIIISNSTQQSLHEKLIVAQLVMIFPAFYGTQKYYVQKDLPVDPILSQLHPPNNLKPCFFNMPRSPSYT
jgi:hypothetical protein